MKDEEFRKAMDEYLRAWERLIEIYREYNQTFQQALAKYPDMQRRWEEQVIEPLLANLDREPEQNLRKEDKFEISIRTTDRVI